MMNKEEKINYINEMKTAFESNNSIYVTHYQGLTMVELDELRSEMRNHGIKFQITKNKITKIALKESKFKVLSDFFTGPTAVALSKDPISSAKILTNFSKNHQNLKILGGVMDNELLKVEDVNKIATLPTLEEARAKITGILVSSQQKLLSILLAPAEKIAILAREKSKQSN